MKQVLWKSYAVIFCSIQALYAASMDWGTQDIAILIWYLVGCLALIGFAFQIKVAVPGIWKTYFALLTAALSLFAVFVIYGAIGRGATDSLGQMSLILLVQVPFWYAVWAYAYRSKQLWAQGV